MNEIKKGYKVVTKDLESTNYDNKVQYKVDEFVGRPDKRYGPLCVFDDIERAKHFFHVTLSGKNKKIYECEYIPSKQEYIRGVWTVFPSEFVTHTIDCLPEGTKLANKVKLIKEVE